jgi:asparagine synthase (glutamine-hydrolysing)
MCSIAGYLRTHRPAGDAGTAQRMLDRMSRRGPDGRGIYLAEGGPRGHAGELLTGRPAFEHRLALAHNRFAVTDPSPAGHQPFLSPDGRYALIFNGEIYNHRALRPELSASGWRFRSQCDTEVLLAALIHWGDSAFSRFNGTWALAFWDNHTAQLLLSRDRFGEAPLFLASMPGGAGIAFASEIHALMAACDSASHPVRSQAVSDYLFHGLTDLGGQTFHEGIRQLPAASFMRVSAGGSTEPVAYWSLPERRYTPRQLPVAEAVAQVRSSLTDAMTLRLRSDVPVAFQLSGGVDSSALAALAAASGAKFDAFTVSYPGTRFDEFPFARQVVERFPGLISHHELRDPGDEFWDDVDSVVANYGEPFSGPNAHTQQLTWRRMRSQGIRVVVGGGAGDEVFAGYRRDFHGLFLAQLLRSGQVVPAVREAALLSEQPVRALSPAALRRLRDALRPALPRPAAGCVAVSSPGSAFHDLPIELLPTSAALPKPSVESSAHFDDRIRSLLTYWRMPYYCKIANLSSLSVPVELRLPFLDHELVELAFRLPAVYLIRDGWMKWILRKSAEHVLPPEVTWRRKKMGFPFPYSDWTLRSREPFLNAIGDSKPDYLDLGRLTNHWEALSRLNPIFLWRCMSYALWHRRCVEGHALQPAGNIRSAA